MKTFRIGRAPDNDIVIDHPAVSGHHATLVVSDSGAVTLQDHSTNGTLVNGTVIHNGSVNVSSRDSVVFPGKNPLNWSLIVPMTGSQPYNYGGSRQGSGTQPYNYGGSRQGGGLQPYNQGGSNLGNGTQPFRGNSHPGGGTQPFDRGGNSGGGSGWQRGARPQMTFIEAVKTCFNNYVNFNGRARRSEYWWFVLFNLIGSAVAAVIDGIGASGVVSGIWALALLLPGIAVAVRRLHDIGKSGWYYLFNFIPLVGSIILIVWMCNEGDPQVNEYGVNPKYY